MKFFSIVGLIFLLSTQSFGVSIFDNKTIVKVTLTAPFKKLLDYRKGRSVRVAKQKKIEGELVYSHGEINKVYKVKIKMKGNWTMINCAFPKLELQFDQPNKNKNSFFNVTAIDIGTHCFESEELNKMKDIVPVEAPHRESFLYSLAEKLNILTFRTQPALIHYYDSTESEEQDKGFKGKLKDLGEQKAFFLEDMDTLKDRLGAKEILSRYENEAAVKKTPVVFDNLQTNTKVSLADVFSIYLFEALIGNGDWIIKNSPESNDYRELWNIKMLIDKKNNWYIIPYDFNFAANIAGNRGGDIDRKVIEIQQPELLKEVIEQFMDKKEMLIGAIEEVKQDEIFYASLSESIKAFYKDLEALKIMVESVH